MGMGIRLFKEFNDECSGQDAGVFGGFVNFGTLICCGFY